MGCCFASYVAATSSAKTAHADHDATGSQEDVALMDTDIEECFLDEPVSAPSSEAIIQVFVAGQRVPHLASRPCLGTYLYQGPHAETVTAYLFKTAEDASVFCVHADGCGYRASKPAAITTLDSDAVEWTT